MFVIVHNNSVILGPMRWNRFRFQNEILEETEVEVTLADRNDELTPVIVDDNIQILPVQGTPNPSYNSKIEMLNGPFWEFTATAAISSYQVENLPIDAVKNQLKDVIATNRYNKEVGGCKTTVQETEVRIDTSRDGRNVFVQKFLLMGDSETVQWKFPEGWLTLTKAELGAIVTTGTAHVQTCFEWEAGKLVEINDCDNLASLDAIVLTIDPVVTPTMPGMPV